MNAAVSTVITVNNFVSTLLGTIIVDVGQATHFLQIDALAKVRLYSYQRS